MNTVDVLIAARKLIERPENWGKGSLHGRRGTLCAAEAISCVRRPFARSEIQTVSRALMDVIGPKWDRLIDWNDAPERTHAEVLSAFDRAIEAERAKL